MRRKVVSFLALFGVLLSIIACTGQTRPSHQNSYNRPTDIKSEDRPTDLKPEDILSSLVEAMVTEQPTDKFYEAGATRWIPDTLEIHNLIDIKRIAETESEIEAQFCVAAKPKAGGQWKPYCYFAILRHGSEGWKIKSISHAPSAPRLIQ